MDVKTFYCLKQGSARNEQKIIYKLKRGNIEIFSNEQSKQKIIIFNEKKAKPTKKKSHTILKMSQKSLTLQTVGLKLANLIFFVK
jgi:hypothetical protein